MVKAQKEKRSARSTIPRADCPRCQEWPVTPADLYCAFCGHLLLRFSMTPEAPIIAVGPGFPNAGVQDVTLSNDSDRPFEVEVEAAGKPWPVELTVDQKTLQIPANDQRRVRFKVDPGKLHQNLQETKVHLRFVIDKDQRKAQPFQLTVRSGPRPVVTPDPLDFGKLQEGKSSRQTLEIKNCGGMPLVLDGVTAEGSKQLELDLTKVPRRIPKNGTAYVPVVWKTKADQEIQDFSGVGIRIRYKNPPIEQFVQVVARFYRFAIELRPNEIDVSPVFSKQGHVEKITLHNRGTIDADIVSIEADQPWIQITRPHKTFTLLAANPAEKRSRPQAAAAGQTYSFQVVCRTEGLPEDRHKGTVTVLTADRNTLTLPIRIDVRRPEEYLDYIGIDFGTTNSVVAVYNEEKHEIEYANDGFFDSPLIPSVLVLHGPDSYKIGYEAQREAPTMPDRTIRSIKRVMGYDRRHEFFGREYQPENLAGFIIKKLIEFAERKLYDVTGTYYDVRRAIITVPANFYDLQIQGILTACEQAGLDTEGEHAQERAAILRDVIGEEVNTGVILDEPSAAALFFIHHLEGIQDAGKVRELIDRDLGLTLVVFDYGGGTLDVSVTRLLRLRDGTTGLRILANMGNNRLGGDSIDEMVTQELLKICKAGDASLDDSLISATARELQQRKDREGWSDAVWARVLGTRMSWKDVAEEVKIELSDQASVRKELRSDMIIHLENGEVKSSGRSLFVDYEQNALASLMGSTLDACARLVEDALKLAGIEASDVDYVLHSGRQSLMPAIYDRIQTIFPHLDRSHHVLDKEHVKICVARGATLYGLTRYQPMDAAGGGASVLYGGRRLPHGYGIGYLSGVRQIYEAILPIGTEYPLELRLPFDSSSIPPGGRIRLKFYQNTGTSTIIAGNPEMRLIGQFMADFGNDLTQSHDLTFSIDANRRLEIFVDDKPVPLKAIRQSDEDEWMG